uniref:TFIIIC_sub6 domain-containing protein n=1 Tax=Echinostoma caproni TaxID=27848 RepID=A0A183B1M5_9TREM
LRSVAWGSAITTVSLVYAFCPTEEQYHSALVDSGLDLWEVPMLLRNPRSVDHVLDRFDVWSRGRLRVSEMGLFAVVWRDDSTQECMLYSESCPYVFPSNGGGQFTSLVRLFLFDRPNETGLARLSNIISDRILDIGFLGRWWFMHQSMQDYDINPNECLVRRAADDPVDPVNPSVPGEKIISESGTKTPCEVNPPKSHKDPAGSTSVHSSANDQDDENEWEVMDEELVFVDCRGVIEPDVLIPHNPVSLVDLDSNHPLVQVGPAVFEGHYENVIGTLMFINSASTLSGPQASYQTDGGTEQSETNIALDRPSCTRYPAPTLSVLKCTKTLVLDRIFLKPKQMEMENTMLPTDQTPKLTEHSYESVSPPTSPSSPPPPDSS